MILSILIVGMVFADETSTSIRQQELSQTTRQSVLSVLTGSNLRELYDISEVELQAEFIQDFAASVNSDSDYEINFLGLDESGLLDVKVKSTWGHINGKKSNAEYRKSGVVEYTANK